MCACPLRIQEGSDRRSRQLGRPRRGTAWRRWPRKLAEEREPNADTDQQQAEGPGPPRQVWSPTLGCSITIRTMRGRSGAGDDLEDDCAGRNIPRQEGGEGRLVIVRRESMRDDPVRVNCCSSNRPGVPRSSCRQMSGSTGGRQLTGAAWNSRHAPIVARQDSGARRPPLMVRRIPIERADD